LAKKNCHPVRITQKGSHCIAVKYHAARATERNHGHAIVYLEAVTAKNCCVWQKRLAAHAGIGTSRHQSNNRRTSVGKRPSNK
jgi:hypothetical protein